MGLLLAGGFGGSGNCAGEWPGVWSGVDLFGWAVQELLRESSDPG